MSHFTVLVIGDNVEEQLAPYHEYECTGIKDQYVKFLPPDESEEELKSTYETHKERYESFDRFMKEYYGYEQNNNGQWGRFTNPNSKWDWWVVGGRWTGFFKLKSGRKGELGESGTFGNKPRPGGADIVCKGDVDWDGMRNEVVKGAEHRWVLVNEGIKNTQPCKLWDELKNEFGVENLGKVRDLYYSQERIKSFQKVVEKNRNYFGFFSNIEEYLCDKETYIERCKNSAVSTFALVKDGVWYQKGKMGWWGMCTPEMTQDEWDTKFWNMINELPDETLLTLVDCHI